MPFAWVTADEVYGSDPKLRATLEQQHLAYVLAVRRSTQLWQGFEGYALEDWARHLGADAWRCISAGKGAKGEREYDWAWQPFAALSDEPAEWTHGLLIRRSRETGECAYYFVFAPAGTPLEALVAVAGRRWAIEAAFESAKGEVGLDQYEVRKYHAWYRYITLALLAHAFLVVCRKAGEKGGPAKAS